MACNIFNGKCGCCRNLIPIVSAKITAGVLILNIPAGTYRNNQEVCLLISQDLPVSATPIPVAITIGSTVTQYLLVNKCGNGVYSDQIRSRRLYCTSVKTDTKMFKYNGCRNLPCTSFVFGAITGAVPIA